MEELKKYIEQRMEKIKENYEKPHLLSEYKQLLFCLSTINDFAEQIASQLKPPNEAVAGGSLKEKVAKCLFRIWWNGRPSLEYGFTTLPQGLEGGYLSDKENWDREAEYLIKIITASQREA